jgi:lysophospholipase L1-like esterase
VDSVSGVQHIALLGDSIFDNGRYTGDEPDVVTHLRALLPAGWTAALCAIDGSVASSVAGQVPRIPAATTLIVVSVGGNDALRSQPLLHAATGSAVWRGLAAAQAEFAADYRAAMVALKATGRKVLACTIYDGNLPEGEAAAARAALAVFNDTIYRTANELGVPVLELRRVCTEPSDYANPIEPSGSGGRKIARAVLARLTRSVRGA